MIEFLGRLHPLIVHLPIGILILAAFFNLLSRYKTYKNYKAASRAALFIGSLFAVVACVTGIILSNESHDASIVTQHKYLGMGTAFIAMTLLFVTHAKKVFKKKVQKNTSSTLYLIMILLLFATGHLGGSLTHGSEFLFPNESEQMSVSASPISFDASASIYLQLIKPVFQEKCYDCHSSKKQKGKLRLDSDEFILKGGKSGSILNDIDKGQGELLYRIHLPIEDEDHMPPSDNDQLTSGEIDLLAFWINSGASFSSKLSEYSDSSILNTYIQSKFSIKKTNWWPPDNVNQPNTDVIDNLFEAGVSVEFLSKESNYLSISFVSIDSLQQSIWKNLFQIRNNIISMRLSGIKVSQKNINQLESFAALRKLYLDQSLDSTVNLGSIFKLTELRYLNLSNNPLELNQMSSIKNLVRLEHLYLTNTSITREDLNQLKNVIRDCEIEFEPPTLKALSTDTVIYRKR
jgi:uncharacterized membrane protein